jgi:DNA-binding NarL/FixJ family response regulator
VVAPSTTRRLLERFAPRLPDPAEPQPADELETLTPREREVVGAVARGLTNSEIADELVLSEATVKTHVHNIYRKLNVGTRVEMVMAAVRLDLIPAVMSVEPRDQRGRAR